MPIVHAAAGSHAPGLTAWSDAAPAAQREKLFAAFETVRLEFEAAKPDVLLLLTSEHWANYFEHIGAFCIGRSETYEGPIEPWLKVPKTQVQGDLGLSEALLTQAYGAGYELNYAYEMKLDHGSMVPLHFLTPNMDCKVVPLLFDTLASPRPSAARCVGLGQALKPVLEASQKRIAIFATGGLSHDPGERNHGHIDTAFDATFIERLQRADLKGLASYTDAQIVAAGAGTTELLAWCCLAGIMGERHARLVAYEPVKAWATGVGVVSYAQAA